MKPRVNKIALVTILLIVSMFGVGLLIYETSPQGALVSISSKGFGVKPECRPRLGPAQCLLGMTPRYDMNGKVIREDPGRVYTCVKVHTCSTLPKYRYYEVSPLQCIRDARCRPRKLD